jgi:hypothetical protein
MEKYKEGMGNFSRYVRFMMGDGTHIHFGHDVGCDEQFLKETFPKLFGIARHKNALVVDHMYFSSSNFHWDINFIRSVQNWELKCLSNFKNLSEVDAAQCLQKEYV